MIHKQQQAHRASHRLCGSWQLITRPHNRSNVALFIFHADMVTTLEDLAVTD